MLWFVNTGNAPQKDVIHLMNVTAGYLKRGRLNGNAVKNVRIVKLVRKGEEHANKKEKEQCICQILNSKDVRCSVA